MMNEAIRKRLLMSHDLFGPKRWEGKSLNVKFKFALANYPEILFCSMVCFVFCPLVYLYRTRNLTETREYALRKYRATYTVVRHDDPSVPELLKEKELGRHHFPE